MNEEVFDLFINLCGLVPPRQILVAKPLQKSRERWDLVWNERLLEQIVISGVPFRHGKPVLGWKGHFFYNDDGTQRIRMGVNVSDGVVSGEVWTRTADGPLGTNVPWMYRL